jgi:hypothetical protein
MPRPSFQQTATFNDWTATSVIQIAPHNSPLKPGLSRYTVFAVQTQTTNCVKNLPLLPLTIQLSTILST